MNVNDNYRNAVVGRITEVANRSWGNPDSRMVVIETDDPFARIIVRVFVKNWTDAEVLIDREVVCHDGYVYPIVGK